MNGAAERSRARCAKFTDSLTTADCGMRERKRNWYSPSRSDLRTGTSRLSARRAE